VTTPEIHRCHRGRLCAAWEPDQRGVAGARRGAAIDAAEGLCPACERRVTRAIADLPAVYTQLETIIGEHRSAGEFVSGTRDQPIPPRLDVIITQADIDAVLTAWAAPLASRIRVGWNPGRMAVQRGGVRVTRAAHMLAAHTDALLRIPVQATRVWVAGLGPAVIQRSGIHAALDLLALHQRGKFLVTGGSGDARLPVPCPHCEALALVRANGADQVDCRACGRSWPESDYRRLCLILADDYRAGP
jgi:ribosomal protein S27E